MKKLLNILGAITLIGSIIFSTIIGFSGGSLVGPFGSSFGGSLGGFLGVIVGFFVGVISGIFASAIFFGLAAILDGQERILYKLSNPKDGKSPYNFKDKLTCTKCKKEYDYDYSSCPHCGFKA